MKLDLNCDLGEGEPARRTRGLMRWITSANVACGGHAGTPASMEQCVEWVRECKVRLGAHPGVRSGGDFGRGAVAVSPDELEWLLRQQVGALETVARRRRVPLHHIKLHGALYHAAETEPELARTFIQTVKRDWPETTIFCKAGGRLARLARAAGMQPWEEVFADRLYAEDGSLIPRTEPGALLAAVPAVLRQVESILRGTIVTCSGRMLPVAAQTICVHSDTPNALRIAASIRKRLDATGPGAAG
jgi:5-oxoprolinase (ATP-hydrolysing) subunit A